MVKHHIVRFAAALLLSVVVAGAIPAVDLVNIIWTAHITEQGAKLEQIKGASDLPAAGLIRAKIQDLKRCRSCPRRKKSSEVHLAAGMVPLGV